MIDPGHPRLSIVRQREQVLMERLVLAIKRGNSRLLARCGSSRELQFCNVPADVFAAYRIIDWKNGVAEGEGGDRLYAVHVAPRVGSPDELRIVRSLKASPRPYSVAAHLSNLHAVWSP